MRIDLGGEHDGVLPEQSLERLMMIARALTGDLSPQEIVEIVVRQGMAELDADGGVIAVTAPDALLAIIAAVGTTLPIVSKIGPLKISRQLPITVAVRDEIPVWVPDRDDARLRFPELLAASPDSRAWAALPLTARGAVVGALGITFLVNRQFSVSERAFLTSLADLAGPALLAALPPPEPVPTSVTTGSGIDARALLDLTINRLFAVTLTLGLITNRDVVDRANADRLLRAIDELDASIVQLRRLVGASRITPTAPTPPNATKQRAHRPEYGEAISLMITATTDPGAARAAGASDVVVSGLVELCGELLQRYEHLSAVNRHAQLAVSSIEHLIWLQRLFEPLDTL